MFTGRLEEIEAIEKSLFQTKNGNPKHFLIEGERGIGKSSLMVLVEAMAKRGSLRETVTFRFIVISLELSVDSTYENISQRIYDGFKKQVAELHKVRAFAEKAWNFALDWKAFGVEYKKSGKSDSTILVDELCEGFSKFIENTGPELDGILITMDEADKAPVAANLGLLVKLLTERLSKLECEKVCLGLSGLSQLRAKLRESHESSIRIFEKLFLEPLEKKESARVIQRGLEECEKKSSVKVTIENDAQELLVTLSEGYPHFIQQFAYSAFDADTDNNITVEDVRKGAFDPNGALDQLGNRYFSELYFERINSDDYRKVLNSMADAPGEWITKADIRKISGVKDSQVSNALHALRDRGIVVSDPHSTGKYKLPTRSFGVWIKALSEKAKAKV